MTWHSLRKIVFLGVDPAQPPHLFILLKKGEGGVGWWEGGRGAREGREGREGWTDGCRDGWMDRWMVGWIDR